MECLENENIPFCDVLKRSLLSLLSKICIYEEEEVKIRPMILVARNLDSMISKIPSLFLETVRISDGCDITGKDMMKQLKAIIPFCNNGWTAYINIIEDSHISYGVIRSFGLKTNSFTDLIFSLADSEDGGLLYFSVKGKTEIFLKGLKTVDQVIDTRFISSEGIGEQTNAVDMLLEDITRGVTSQKLSEIKILYSKLLQLTLQKVHGTICTVIKKDVNLNDIALFKDGIRFSEIIDLTEYAEKALMEKADSSELEKYYAISGLMLEMMNVDGITIIDEAGRIRGYNIFVESQQGIEITGGARTRAAHTIVQSKNKNIVGVYLQSQDGNASYWRNDL
ncbi:hypothetical protein O9H85_00225 [Paenibacillus filicis]|uniref:DAC domain-containing protein n=1 Tax=Paenibacillus gyeongsangnamensis TaxID=3388067 RepID=A0ABT4Q1Y0_9BACL|nr:hypothetical protein [Paenibacillus filicis]MCZ8510889.1 hypothetical protein [Paenibacillus filicis]